MFSLKHLRLREQRRQSLQKFAQKAPQPTALKPPSTARTAGRSGGCGGACDASPLSCFLFRPRKSRKSAGNAVIPTFPTHWSHGLQHLRRKRRNVRFEGLRRVHTCLRQQDRTQRLTRRNTGLPSLGHSTVLCCQRNRHHKNSRRKRMHAYGVCPLPPASRPRWAA